AEDADIRKKCAAAQRKPAVAARNSNPDTTGDGKSSRPQRVKLPRRHAWRVSGNNEGRAYDDDGGRAGRRWANTRNFCAAAAADHARFTRFFYRVARTHGDPTASAVR